LERVMKVCVKSVFDCPPSWAWEKVQTSAHLLRITKPVVNIEAIQGTTMPEIWQEGTQVNCRLTFFGFLPGGRHALGIEEVDAEAREIQSSEGGTLVKSWRHRIRVQKADDGETLYSDEIEIDAGWLTPLVWVFAQLFYRHRQRQWKKIIKEEKQDGSMRRS